MDEPVMSAMRNKELLELTKLLTKFRRTNFLSVRDLTRLSPILTLDEVGVKLSTVLRVVLSCSLNLSKIKFRQVRLRDDYNYGSVGKVRSKLVNDGTFRSVLTNYLRFVEAYDTWSIDILCKLVPSELNVVLSELGILVKNYLLPYCTSEMVKLLDISTLVGYPTTKDRIFSDDVKAWLVDDVEHDATVDDIYREICDILGTSTRPYSGDSFEKWLLKRYTWIGPGAMNKSKLVINDDRIKTKFGAALSLSDNELLAAVKVRTVLSDGLRAFVKADEKGLKGRNIINAPFGLYTTQKFVLDYMLESGIVPREFANFIEPEEKNKYLSQLSLDSVDLVPVDFSSFDYNISSKYWIAFKRWCSKYLPVGIVEQAMVTFEVLGRIFVYDADGLRVGNWNKGMPSGFYWTNYLDSLFNLVANRLVSRIDKTMKIVYVSGDDTAVMSKLSTSELTELYPKLTGMVVNKKKTWKHPNMVEFLKCLYYNGFCIQYPARVFASIAWSSGDFRDNDPVSKLFSVASLWKEFFDRCSKFDKLLMVEDLHASSLNRLRLTKKKLLAWLHTSTALGGFGLYPVRFDFKFKGKYEQMPDKVVSRFKLASFSSRLKYYKCEWIGGLHRLRFNKTIVGDTIERYFGDDYSFKQWLAWYNAERGVLSDLVPFRPIKSSDSFLFVRIFGYSDIFIKSKFPDSKLDISDITSVTACNTVVRLARLHASPMLWK